MASITPALRATRSIVRAKTTPHTAARIGWTVVAFATLAYLSTRGTGLWVAVAMGLIAFAFYGAGRYTALDRVERDEKPYAAELEGVEPLDAFQRNN